MNTPIAVHIIGAPIACKDGVKDAWREVAAWTEDHLHQRFGDAVAVTYFDLFDPACPPMPPEAQLPLVLVNGERFSSGGKISVPALSKKIHAMLQSEMA